MKQLLMTFLYVCLLFIPSKGYAQDIKVYYRGVLFNCIFNDNAFTITSFDEKADTVVIPSTLEYAGQSKAVFAVDTYAKNKVYNTLYLTLEEGIQKVEKKAFFNCPNLIYVKLPNSIRYIGKNAFSEDNSIVYDAPNNLNDVFKGKSYNATSIGGYLKGGLVGGLLGFVGGAETAKTFASSYSQIIGKKRDENTNIETNKGTGNKDGQSQNEKPIVKKNALGTTKNNIVSVDKNIPKNSNVNNHTYCVIIANDNYLEAPHVDYAINDGKIFKEYCHLTLGIPENQIRTFINAGYTDIIKAIRFLENIQTFDKNAKLILYYSGHGIPNEQDRTAFLLPVDGSPMEIQTCVSLKTLYDRLGKIKSKNVCVLIDACFSGTNRGGEKGMTASRGIVRIQEDTTSGNTIVFTAASADETAFALKEANHGLFTYYLLKGIKDSKGKIKLGELFRGIKEGVSKYSVLENDKPQTPSSICSPSLSGKWEDIYF